MTSVLVVDWLGRGGIAQTSRAWSVELSAAGASVTVVTRPARELADTWSGSDFRTERSSRILQHMSLVRRAVSAVEALAPDVVVIQNHVLPPLEGAVDRVSRRRGSFVVRVVHDHILHSRAAGTQVGLRRLLRGADLLVAHSHFVGDRVRSVTDRNVSIVPLPELIHPSDSAAHGPIDDHRPLAVQFGVLNRSYKDQDALGRLAVIRPDWALVTAGVGAKAPPGGAAIDRFLPAAELASLVAGASAALFPYRFATQSGGVAVSQALGTVPIATAVGGIVEQIEDGKTGLLVPARSPAERWANALDRLGDADERSAMEAQCLGAAAAARTAFASFVASVVGAGAVA